MSRNNFGEILRYPMPPATRNYIDCLSADIIIRGGTITVQDIWKAHRELGVGEMQVKVGREKLVV